MEKTIPMRSEFAGEVYCHALSGLCAFCSHSHRTWKTCCRGEKTKKAAEKKKVEAKEQKEPQVLLLVASTLFLLFVQYCDASIGT